MPARFRSLAILAAITTLAGCCSRFVEATITNQTQVPIQTVELDYPGGSFGLTTLAPGATYAYRFKSLSSGPTTLTYTQNSKPATSTGPTLKAETPSTLNATITPGQVRWSNQPH